MIDLGMPTFRVDFNSVDLQGRVKTLKDHAQGVIVGLQVGQMVRLVDEDQNTCEAVVVDLGDRLIRLQPVWETWRTGVSLSFSGAARYPGPIRTGSLSDAQASQLVLQEA